ncbi:hypothetical protein K435DRAFT_967073 [Dendrothele bispora CBS 962.96]|uniref:RING-type domain-containing protein n=1 Tax=Dendrothele bispora (strain CBS 962.96) TaxID=1314807 RepID=A0A4S8LWB3_DENBC|nr:hypothetical protein K435DRAFT_967073 [Dendrothele bispora CBS 962.96]
MPSLAPDSTCDICFESFDGRSRKPCSTTCGHIFCYSCFNNIRGQQQRCPHCRSSMQTAIELHLDLEHVRTPQAPGSSSSRVLRSSTRSQKASTEGAQRLLTEIDNLGGTLAVHLVDPDEMQCLISRCQTFLQLEEHRADQFQGLLTSYHLLLHISSVLEELRSQRETETSLRQRLNSTYGQISAMSVQVWSERQAVAQSKETWQRRCFVFILLVLCWVVGLIYFGYKEPLQKIQALAMAAMSPE